MKLVSFVLAAGALALVGCAMAPTRASDATLQMAIFHLTAKRRGAFG